MNREQELLQIILEMRELARLQVRLGEQDAEAVVDWKALDVKLSKKLRNFLEWQKRPTSRCPMLSFAWPGEIDGLWNWILHDWKIVKPITQQRYSKELGTRIFGIEWVRFSEHKGQVL